MLLRDRAQILNSLAYHVAYVALSRCTSLAGLEVHNFSPATVIAHAKYVYGFRSVYKIINSYRRVLEWSKNLKSISDSRLTAAQQPAKSPTERPAAAVSFARSPANHPRPTEGQLVQGWSDDEEEELAMRIYHSL
ncbi:hypothetical protein BDV93DRAFT_38768 [Ceratobasidium sp. AG-I]|nr:hypothetical protein BDV93DRAFT_38768 [Ceratobasidium sp. AG-I]